MDFTPFGPEDIEQSLVERFEQQVDRHAHRLAIGWGEDRLTYAELDRRANGLARAICGHLPRASQQPVALLLSQGAAVLAAILGVLKSHNLYAPIDPATPIASLHRLLHHLRPCLVLTEEAGLHADLAGWTSCPVLDLAKLPSTVPDSRLGRRPGPDSLAYVFHTSGTTGRPKGVFDCHRNVLHNVLRYTNSLKLGPGDRLTLLQAPWFSGAVSSMFGALLNGAAIFPYDASRQGLGPPLTDWLGRERITVYHSVPAIFRTLDIGERVYPAVRIVRLEGDVAMPADVAVFHRRFPHATLVNGLGTTETGLVRQYFLRSGEPLQHPTVPVGYATVGTEALVVGEDGYTLPPGRVGEIVIRSKYLALGYWGDPERTAAVFSHDPERPGWRRYRTGDAGLMHQDGCLEHRGRRDALERLHGRWIDAVEIEARLTALAGVREAAVATKLSAGCGPRLVGYVVANAAGPLSQRLLRAALARDLPSFMVPSRIEFVASLPRTVHGKIDRAALPHPTRDRPLDAPPFDPPLDEIERVVASLWERITAVLPVGRDDDFFDLGGTSLDIAWMMAELERITGRSVPHATLVTASTIAALAAALHDVGETTPANLIALRRHGARTPLFLVHGHEGEVLSFAALARRLGDQQPVYGLQAVPESATHPAPKSVEEMASRYLEQVRAVQPEGPYGIGGLCYGAAVALEMARQLQRTGQGLTLLALLDPRPVDFRALVPRDAVRRYRRHERAARHTRYRAQFTRWPWPKRLRYGCYVLAQAARAGSRHVGWHLVRMCQDMRGQPMPPRWRDMERRNVYTYASHVPQPFPGAAAVFLPSDVTSTYTDKPHTVWAAVADRVDVHVVATDMNGILSEPSVGRLAEALAARLAG